MKFKPGDKVVRTTRDCTLYISTGTITVKVGEVYTVMDVNPLTLGIRVFPVTRPGDMGYFSSAFFEKANNKFIKRVKKYVPTSRNK